MMKYIQAIIRPLTAVALMAATGCAAEPRVIAPTDPTSPLQLEREIVLPAVSGRIDHLTLDPTDQVLFVTEYKNGSVEQIDLDKGKVTGRITGLHQPQGIAYLESSRQIVVTCGDGSVRFYASTDLKELGRIELGEDADNVRIDVRNGDVIVGYGGGGLAVIDPGSRRVTQRLLLRGHPEGFRLLGSRALINVPDRGEIVAGDIDRGTILSSWPTGLHRLNFPLALAPGDRWFAVAYRLPATLARYDIASGALLSAQSSCGDADDLFVDATQIYVICGAGHIDVVPLHPDDATSYRVSSASGARTGLFSPELQRLYVAAPAHGISPARVLVFRVRSSADDGSTLRSR